MTTFPDFQESPGVFLGPFRRAFPGRTVVTVNAEDIIEYGGAIRCVTRTPPDFKAIRAARQPAVKPVR